MLEAGLGANTFTWADVQLARTTRTCAYDCAGNGNSVAPAGVHDARNEIEDLERLLDHARIAPPWVLVGHSYGGLLHLHVVALRSGHFAQGSDGQPAVVIRAVRAVVSAARDGTRLPPCTRLFSGSDVRCRG